MVKPVIYEPKGRAAEYSHLAVNLYRGRCEHECMYCYCPKTLRLSREQWLSQEPEVRPGIIKSLKKQVPKFAGTDRRVLLCFLNDPYSPIALRTGTTRDALSTLREHDVPFQVLTKGGIMATRDFDLYGPRDAFAVTLTFATYEQAKRYEPYAERPENRIVALQRAHALGIETWVSLEPVIDPAESLALIELTHEYVDLYKVGTWNYQRTETDWRAFGAEAVRLCRSLRKPYFIKADLAMYLKGIRFTNTDNRTVRR